MAEPVLQLHLAFDATADELAAAAEARAQGIGQADANAAPDWKTAARDAIAWCALHHETFTADEVLDRLSAVGAPQTHNLAALGPAFLAVAKLGLVAKTGAQRPSRFRRRHRDLTVWAGRR